MFIAKIHVTLRKSILDPQGKAIHHTLESLGMKTLGDVRIGKYIEMKVDAPSREQAERITAEACKKLLANPVMEDYHYSLEQV